MYVGGCDSSKYLQLFSLIFNNEACAGLLGDAGPSRRTGYVNTLDQEGMPRVLSRISTSRSSKAYFSFAFRNDIQWQI